jgi:hypothetical protein
MAVCTATDLPLAWNVRTARENESLHALPLLEAARARGFAAETCAMDKGYDVGPVYDGCEARDCRPIIPLRDTPAVLKGEHKPPICEHGEWRFAGSDSERGASKWRCPTGECSPRSRWIRRIASTRSSRARRPASPPCTVAAPPSSASSAGSKTSGRLHRYGSVGWIGFGYTPT